MLDNAEKINIVGIGGLPRSGKDTLAEIFIQKGYFGISLGDIVRDASRKRHTDELNPISVANMTETANWLRHENGADFALKEALRLYKESVDTGNNHRGLLVWSVRSPAEVDFILAHDGELIWMDTDDEIRLERSRRDKREGEPEPTMEEMRAQESLQWKPQDDISTPREAQMHIEYVKDKATRKFVNHSDDLTLFEKQATEIISDL